MSSVIYLFSTVILDAIQMKNIFGTKKEIQLKQVNM